MGKSKKCLVIGASSFIGVYVVSALLDEGFSVAGTGRNRRFRDYYDSLGVKYMPFDLDEPEDVDKLPRDVDFVIHLAGRLPANSSFDLKTKDDAGHYIKTNTLGVASLLEWCRENGIRRIISTTSYADVQKRWNAGNPVSEEWPRDFLMFGDHAAYVISKNAACDLLMYYNGQYDMKNIVFRLPPVYGCGPHESLRVNGIVKKSGIGMFIDKARAGEAITVYGDAEHALRDIVYVKDVASAFVRAGESENAAGLYNIGSGKSVSLLEQAEAIASVFAGDAGESVVEIDDTRANGIASYSFCIEKAVKDFGYKPEYADFKRLMMDWKAEEERGAMSRLFSLDNGRGGGCELLVRPISCRLGSEPNGRRAA